MLDSFLFLFIFFKTGCRREMELVDLAIDEAVIDCFCDDWSLLRFWRLFVTVAVLIWFDGFFCWSNILTGTFTCRWSVVVFLPSSSCVEYSTALLFFLCWISRSIFPGFIPCARHFRRKRWSLRLPRYFFSCCRWFGSGWSACAFASLTFMVAVNVVVTVIDISIWNGSLYLEKREKQWRKMTQVLIF